jgi:RNA polymerase sigma-70 factor (ECF subfamily)
VPGIPGVTPAGRPAGRRAGENAAVPDVAADYADDAVLVAGLRSGDEAAFAWLLDRYRGSLTRLARSFVSNAAAADEAVQETWLAVITGIDRFEGRSSVKTWLHRILVNVARSKGVKEHRSIPFASLTSELDADEPAVDPACFLGSDARRAGAWASPPVPWDTEPEARLLSLETRAAVEAAIAALAPNQRRVITLRDVEGFSSSEVCNALDLSETNQRVLLHRARAKVRQALEDHFEDATP